jgi:hypothetical protein
MRLLLLHNTFFVQQAIPALLKLSRQSRVSGGWLVFMVGGD